MRAVDHLFHLFCAFVIKFYVKKIILWCRVARRSAARDSGVMSSARYGKKNGQV
jgi:hypothetical protein